MTDTQEGALPSLVLVHGAWHGAWCWAGIVPLIDPGCPRVVALELPFGSIESDIASLRNSIEELGPNVVVCAHSYGGRLASIVADELELRHLVYVAAPAPNADQLEPYRTADRLRSSAVPDFRVAWDTFYNDCDEEVARAAWSQLRPMPTAPGGVVGLEHRPWERVNATYVVCSDDHSLRAEVQRQMAANMRYSVELESDHSPFLSAPEALAATLNSVLRYGHP